MGAAGELRGDGANGGYGLGTGWRLEGSAPGSVELAPLKPGNESAFAQRFRPVCATWIGGARAAGDSDDADRALLGRAMLRVDVYS
jgi:hypothetical protein